MSLITPARSFRAPRIILPRYRNRQDTYPAAITVSGLTATPGLGQVTLAWTIIDPDSYVVAVEVWMAKTNDRTLASHFGDAGSPFTSFKHRVSPQGGANYYWIRPRDGSGNPGAWFPSGATSGVQSTADNIPEAPGIGLGLINGKIVASVASNALTVAVKTLAGVDPTPDKPVFTIVQSATDGGYSIVPITGACTCIISNGSLLGTQNLVGFTLYVFILNDPSGPILGISNPVGISFFGSGNPVVDDGSGNADLVDVIYTNTASVSSPPYSVVASMVWNSGLATAGAWSALPSLTQAYRGNIPINILSPWDPSFTPVLVPQTGAITTYFASCRYKLVGKTCFIDFMLTISNNGTGGGYIDMTLPFAPNGQTVLGGIDVVSGKVLSCYFLSANHMAIKLYDGTYPATTGSLLKISGVFEVL